MRTKYKERPLRAMDEEKNKYALELLCKRKEKKKTRGKDETKTKDLDNFRLIRPLVPGACH